MTLNKKKMVREIGRRTRLKNRDVQLMLETLIDVWTEELGRRWADRARELPCAGDTETLIEA